MPYLDTISDNARAIGSVNTIVKDETGALHGYNTDKYGFIQLVKRSGIDISGRKCIVLGSGGSSKTVRVALKELGAREVRIISRSGEDNYTNLDVLRNADAQVIVNTTPVGMFPNTGVAPVSLDMFPQCEGVLDLIYNPAKTALLLDAERRGIRCANGLHMLVAQAKLASELFRSGTKLDDSVIDDVRASIERQTHNIVADWNAGQRQDHDRQVRCRTTEPAAVGYRRDDTGHFWRHKRRRHNPHARRK